MTPYIVGIKNYEYHNTDTEQVRNILDQQTFICPSAGINKHILRLSHTRIENSPTTPPRSS